MSTASDLLALYLSAETKILAGQSSTLGDRSLADLADVQRERKNLELRVASEASASAGNFRYSVPDFS